MRDFRALTVTITITLVKEPIFGIASVEERPHEEDTDGNVGESIDRRGVSVRSNKTTDFEKTTEQPEFKISYVRIQEIELYIPEQRDYRSKGPDDTDEPKRELLSGV